MRSLRALSLLAAVVVVALASATYGRASDRPAGFPPSTRANQVLLLSSFHPGLPVSDSIQRGILAAMTDGGISADDIFFQDLDLIRRQPSAEHRADLIRRLRRRLAGKHVGIIIAEGRPAVDFVATEGKDLFPDAALLTLVVPAGGPSVAGRTVMTMPWRVDPAGTLRAALDLFPKTRRVLVVDGANDGIVPFLDDAKKAFAPWADRLAFDYTDTMTFAEMLGRVSTLPADSIIIYSPYFADSTGRTFVPAEVVVKVSQAATVPVFATLDAFLGHGILGGSLLRTETIGRRAGQIALDYLQGRLAPTEPVTSFDTPSTTMFDWRELERWKVDPARLPAGSVVANRPATLWSQYRATVVATVAAFLIMATLITALLLLVRRQKRMSDDLLLNNRRSSALQELPQNTRGLSEAEFLQYGVGLAETLTDSAIAFIHFVHEDQEEIELATWSKRTLGRYCTAAFDRHYPVSRAGLWAEALRRRAPVIVNDYANASGRHGLPEGHSVVRRFISAPVMDGEKVRMVLGVGNKASDYTDADVESVSLIGNAIWRIASYRRASAALADSESRLKSLVGSMSDAVITCDQAGSVTYWNRTAADLFGYGPDEILGRPLEMLIPERLRDRHRRGFAAAHEGDFGTRRTIETFALSRDGAEIPIELTPSGWKDDRSWNFTAIVRDISDRRRVQAELAQLEASLRESQKMEALGTLAGGVAHGFNNILATISGNAWLIGQDVGAEHPARESLGEIAKAVERAKDLVLQVLAFSRRNPVNLRGTSLERVVRDTVKMLRATLPAGVDLRLDCEKGTPLVYADAAQVEHVLLNLCTNSWQAMRGLDRPGVIGIRLETAARGGRSLVSLTVSDNGCGMDEATRGRIFEPFFTTKPVGEGTGLGLAVVHGILKEHGADIEVSSLPNKGTSIIIHFPALAEPAPPPSETACPALDEAAGGASGSRADGKRLLIIDDDESLINLMTRALTRQGYHVRGYTDPREALAVVRADPDCCDLVVTDYNMPGMSGLDVASAVKDLRAGVPVVMASGYITEDLKEKARAAGIAELIFKPDSIAEMCAMISRLV